MLKLILLALICSVPSFASVEDELRAFEQVSTLERRLSAYSLRYLDRPYGNNGPLGEGPAGRYDQDPLYRFDTFDCTTFVETVISLARSRTVSDFETEMNGIRYENGVVDYLTRNHFTDLQWIPNNIAGGLFEEINEAIVPASELKVATAEINFVGWLLHHTLEQMIVPAGLKAERLLELKAQASRFPTRPATLTYIPISYLLANPEALERIPHGTVVNFVRPNWDLTSVAGTHLNVSHQGLLFRKNGTVVQRHASTGGTRTVQEIAFIEYLRKFENHSTLKGVHILKIL